MANNERVVGVCFGFSDYKSNYLGNFTVKKLPPIEKLEPESINWILASLFVRRILRLNENLFPFKKADSRLTEFQREI